MAKYEVKEKFRDKHTKKLYEAGSTISLTQERYEEVLATLGESFIQPVETKAKKAKKTTKEK